MPRSTPPTPPQVPSSRDPGSTRQLLLAATAAELEECGHAGVSLRAVARRAGLSHAAPKHHFGDRAGLLTAAAAGGFDALTAVLDEVSETQPRERLALLGRAYVTFGLDHPALFDLMFRPSELHPGDPDLQRARRAAIAELAVTAGRLPAGAGVSAASLTVMAWALVHGLVVLAREGALVDPHVPDDEAVDLARHVVTVFSWGSFVDPDA